jgi:hypothetical protein
VLNPIITNNKQCINEYSNYLDTIFQKEFDKLSQRAQNILKDLEIFSFSDAYNYYINRQEYLKFKYLRNVGEKTNSELINLFNELKNYFSTQPDFNNDNNITLQNNSIQTIENQKIIIFNNKMELEYQADFEVLSTRTKNILKFINSDNIKEFYNFFFLKYPNNFERRIRNCGGLTAQEILKFKINVQRIIDKYENYSNNSGLFSDIEFYIQRSTSIDFKKKEILIRYYGIYNNYEKETLQQIGNYLDLTRERVRQISLEIPKLINYLLVQITKIPASDFNKYYNNDYFIIDDSYANNINSIEGTNFSKQFICYVLSLIRQDHYKFYNVNNKPIEFTGIFYRKDVILNIPKCLNLIRELHFNRKKSSSNKLELENILEQIGYKWEVLTKKSTLLKAKFQLIEIIGLYNNCLPKTKTKLIISDNLLFFKTKKSSPILKHIIDTLRLYKKPMHYKDIFQNLIENNIEVGSISSVHMALINQQSYFGNKGPGYFGMREWGGYFGSIGDVTAEILTKRNCPIPRRELEEILCRELYISKDSIKEVLFHYEFEDRFVKFKNDTIALKSWYNK